MNADTSIKVRTLTDGGQPAAEVARWIAEFVGGAERTLDLAHYDFHLGAESAAIVGRAIAEAAARGVAVRFVYNLDHRNPIPVPPPPEPDAQLIASLGAPARAIAGVPDLMHHKYVVRDGRSVWTGSMNWTDDSFTIQENVVATVDSPELAAAFTLDFEQLWTTGAVERQNGNASWKLPLLEQVLQGEFSGKPSTPWQPTGTPHDFMHAKLTVADTVVLLGSYNLSRSGELNAENVLEIEDAALAERLAAYVDEVRARYPRFVLDGA